MILPSCPIAPAVEETATTLWIQIMFPIAPPAICSAIMEAVWNPRICAVWNSRGPNMTPDTVQEPDTNAPNTPRGGTMKGKAFPMLATIGLFFAVGNWNSWYNGMLFVEKSSLQPLQLVLREMIASMSSDIESPTKKVYSEGLVMASIFFTIVPMMSFYPFLQRFFVKGIVVGAIKG